MLKRCGAIALVVLLLGSLAWAQATQPATPRIPATGVVTDPSAIAAGEWSEEMRGLRGRLLLVEGRVSTNRRETVAYLELRHAPEAVGNTLNVHFDPNLASELRDAEGKAAPQSPGGFGGGRPIPEWVTIPHDSTIRLRLSPYGYGAADGVRINIGQNQWTIKSDDPRTYTLTGTFTNDPPKNSGRQNAWRGTLKLKPMKIAMKGR